jgi:phospholipid transport system substrate-binding protein
MSSVSRRFAVGFAIAVASQIAVPGAVLAQVADPARAPVQALSSGLISIMKGGKKLGFKGRSDQIAPVIDRTFDLPLMTRLAVGPAWTTMTPPDRTALTSAFRRLTIAEHAHNFDDWSGQDFLVDAKVEARGTDRLVKTQLTQPKDASVSLSYRLRQNAGQWRVIDVFYKDAISQLATRRADFGAILAKGGAKALIGHLNQLADKAAR